MVRRNRAGEKARERERALESDGVSGSRRQARGRSAGGAASLKAALTGALGKGQYYSDGPLRRSRGLHDGGCTCQ
jgi:hypothetical protein